MHEMEEGLETLAQDIERERASLEAAGLTNEVLEKMLAYKDELLGALVVAGEVSVSS